MTIPERIGKYEIRRELGKGAMGTVYEGFDPGIERLVEIKTILAEYLANVECDSAVARFKREAQAGGVGFVVADSLGVFVVYREVRGVDAACFGGGDCVCGDEGGGGRGPELRSRAPERASRAIHAQRTG